VQLYLCFPVCLECLVHNYSAQGQLYCLPLQIERDELLTVLMKQMRSEWLFSKAAFQTHLNVLLL
jgi:hypothetical protein